MKPILKNKWLLAILLLLLSIPASLPLLKPGFYEPHDLHHLADIYQMARAIESGQVPPRLGPDFSFGFGYPLFNFYYLLPFYIGSIWFFLSESLTASFKFVFFISVILSVVGMYLFLRQFVKKWPAIVGALLFLYTPYRAVQIYVRGAMGEAFFLALLPFVCWGLVSLIKNPTNKRILATTSVLVFLFIISHNYLWALASPFLAFLILLLVKRKNLKQSLMSLAKVLLLSLGATAYWWLPALVEQRLVSSVTPFPLLDHFPFIKQLIIPTWGYGASVWGPGDGLSFQMGVINLIAFVLVLALLILKRKTFEKKVWKLALWAIVGFLISFVMMNVRAYPVWKLLPFSDFIQFPWRLLMFTTFFTSIMAGVLVELSGAKKWFAGGLIILLSIHLTYNYFRPSQVFYKTDDEYLARMFADRSLTGRKEVVSEEYLNWSEDYLLLPNWVEERPSKLPKSKIESAAAAEILEINEVTPVRWKARVNSEGGAKIIFNSYYFPGWLAKVDGQEVPIGYEASHGQISLNVGQGIHEVEFFWKETPLRKFADLISLFSVLLISVHFFKNNRKKANLARVKFKLWQKN